MLQNMVRRNNDHFIGARPQVKIFLCSPTYFLMGLTSHFLVPKYELLSFPTELDYGLYYKRYFVEKHVTIN